MKKYLNVLAGLLAGAVLLPMLPVLPAAAEEDDTYFIEGIWEVRDYEDGTVSVSLKDKEQTDVEIPKEIRGKTITMIEVDAFNGCESLRSVSVPDTITVIEDYSFYGCKNLEEIRIPKNVVNIGFQAFWGCASLTELSIPAGTTDIEQFAFEGCSSLQGISVAEDNPNYKDEDGILFDREGKTLILYPSAREDSDYVIPDGCTRIEDYAFIGNTHLKSVDMSHITELGEDAFYYCTSLEAAEVPAGIEELDGSVFGNCTSLRSVKLPDGLTVIGESCFYACMALEEIEIPETVTTIKAYAFFNCPRLKSIRLTKNTTSIGDYALGYYYSSGSEPTRLPGFVVDAADDTAAFTYCVNNSIKCTGGITQGSFFVIVIICVIAVVILATVVILILQKRYQRMHELK